jgi:hypothetical protein
VVLAWAPVAGPYPGGRPRAGCGGQNPSAAGLRPVRPHRRSLDRNDQLSRPLSGPVALPARPARRRRPHYGQRSRRLRPWSNANPPPAARTPTSRSRHACTSPACLAPTTVVRPGPKRPGQLARPWPHAALAPSCATSPRYPLGTATRSSSICRYWLREGGVDYGAVTPGSHDHSALPLGRYHGRLLGDDRLHVCGMGCHWPCLQAAAAGRGRCAVKVDDASLDK